MDTKNEYRNWSFLEWEDKVKEYGSKKNLAAALGISADTVRKWMNKAKPASTSSKPSKLTLEEKIKEEKRLLKKAMRRDPKIFERVREIFEAEENTEEDKAFLRKVVREELRLEATGSSTFVVVNK